MLGYAAKHNPQLTQLPTYDQLEMLGVLDFEEHGDPRADADADDLVAMLSPCGIESCPEGAELAEHWAEVCGRCEVSGTLALRDCIARDRLSDENNHEVLEVRFNGHRQ